MKVAYITNSPPQSGMGKPAREIARHLANQPDITLKEFSLVAPPPSAGPRQRRWQLPKPIGWWRLARKLPKAGFNLWHFTNQTLSFIPRRPAVVTVYDLSELIEPQTKFGRPVFQYLYRGIPRAAHVICVSQYTKKTLQEQYNIPDEKITVIPLAAAEVFQPDPAVKQTVAARELLYRFNLTPNTKLILYVGSEHPRKNLKVLLEAVARVRQHIPDVVVLKVGDAGLAAGRQQFLADLDRLGLRQNVRFVGKADDETLKLLYNIADIFVFPSTFEGFGIPPLEAMACGCPVVCSNATSLPEVVGDAALTHNPNDVDAFASSITKVLTTPALAQDLRQRGLARAAQFNWRDIAERTLAVYRQAIH